MDQEKVLNLAKLARINISGDEAENLSHEFEAILNYVGEIKNVSGEESREKRPQDYPVKNVLREDGEGHESGIYTEKILAEAPGSQGGYVKVKKIL